MPKNIEEIKANEKAIEKIRAFYQECNKLLKDITIEWIKEDWSIGETIKGDEVLEYVDTINGWSYGRNGEYKTNIRYKCLKDILDICDEHYQLIGFQSLKNNNLYIQSPYERDLTPYYYNNNNSINHNCILCGIGKNYKNNKECNIYANCQEYKEVLQDEFIKSNNHILAIITMILNCIDFKFYKFDNNLFINSITNIFTSFLIPQDYNHKYHYKNILSFYKTLQIKYNNDIIFTMTINNHKEDIEENDIFNCIYKINDKIINFNLIDFYNTTINYYNYHGAYDKYFLYQKQCNILNQPYGHRVFYNVIYSLENKLSNKVSETSKNQVLINNQLLQNNQEIKVLRHLSQEKSNFNEIQNNLINSLTKSLQEFKEKYENQLKNHHEEFEKLKLEYTETYNETLKETIKELNKLKQENETNKQKLDEILSENSHLKEENEMFNNQLLELFQIYNKDFNHINKISKENLIQFKETFVSILHENKVLNNHLNNKNKQISKLIDEKQKINSYTNQLIELSKNILKLQADKSEDI